MPIVDSKEQMLEPRDIILTAIEQQSTYLPGVEGQADPTDLAYAAIVKEFEDPNGTFLRYGNTIFVIHGSPTKPGTGTFRALNADTARNFLDSSLKFIDDAYDKGYYLLITQFKDPSLVNLFRSVSKTLQQQGTISRQGGYKARQLPDGQIQIVLQLGPQPSGMQPGMQTGMQPEMQPGMQTGMQSKMPMQAPAQPAQGALQQLRMPSDMMGGVK